MPDFPYPRNRNWINEENSPTPSDPVADDVWFEAVEQAIHQGQDHEKAGSGGGGTALVFQATFSSNFNAPLNANYMFPFDTVTIGDPANLGSVPARFIVPEDGVYEARYEVYFNLTQDFSGQNVSVSLQKNGTYNQTSGFVENGTFLSADAYVTLGSGYLYKPFKGSVLVGCVAGDILTLYGYTEMAANFAAGVGNSAFEVIRHA